MAFPASRVKPIDPKTGDWSPEWRDFLWRLFGKTDQTLTPQGQITSSTPVVGRTEGIGTTVSNLTPSGQLNDFANVAAGRTTDNLSDGTGSPLTGGKRGFQALDANNRLQNSFRGNPANVSNTPTSSTTLANDGVSHAVNITAYISQFPAGTVSYNSGSYDPGVFEKTFAYFDDPTFSGGAVIYQFSTDAKDQTAAEGRCISGSITTVGGSAKTGGGSSGGTGGSAGGRGFIPG